MKIPVVFEYEGQKINGTLRQPAGAGSIWHLYVGDYYQGQLTWTEIFGWQYSDQKRDLRYLSDVFGQAIEVAQNNTYVVPLK